MLPWIMFFEGQDLQLFKYGTSSVENVTLIFLGKISYKTGTYCIQVNLKKIWIMEHDMVCAL